MEWSYLLSRQIFLNLIHNTNMLFFDMFYYMVFRFCINTLRRCKEDARVSALFHLAVCFGFFSISMIALIGIMRENYISSLALSLKNGANNPFFTSVIVGIITFIFFGIRYFKIIDIEKIETKIKALPRHKFALIKASVYIFQIAVPLCTYIFLRLYWYGHI